MNKQPANYRIWLAGLLLIPLVMIAAWPTNSACQEHYRADRLLAVNGRHLSAQVVADGPSRQKGLAGRLCLGSDQAMLFVFDKAGYYPFWMRDMRFDIDIVWIGEDHTVADILEDAQPATYPKSFINERPARYVLEVKAGNVRQLGIGTGTFIKF